MVKKLFATALILLFSFGFSALVWGAADEFYNLDEYDNATTKAYYRFSTGDLTSDSKDSHDLTAVNTPNEIDGKFGKAANFATNELYYMAEHDDLAPTGDFSVGAWVNIGNLSATNQIISNYYYKGTSPITRYGWYLAITSAEKIYFHSAKGTGNVDGTDYTTAISDNAIPTGEWVSVIGTWDGTDLKIYVNGVEDDSLAWANAPGYFSTEYPAIGAIYTNTGWGGLFNGGIDDAFIINGKALSSDDVSCIALGTNCPSGATNPCAPTAGQAFYQTQDCYILTPLYHNALWNTNGFMLVVKNTTFKAQKLIVDDGDKAIVIGTGKIITK